MAGGLTQKRRIWVVFFVYLTTLVNGLALNPDDDQSVKNAAGTAAAGMMGKWYTGNETGDVPGNLPAPYYWWEAGAMMMSLVHYRALTGDDSYNDNIIQAIQHQAGDYGDFMVRNQTSTLGNDDQAFWAFAALEAAELKFPDPSGPRSFSWLSLAQGVFNTQIPRWDIAPSTCGGGLNWQVFRFNQGFDYKNAISNGCLFAIAARLGRYTGNNTYMEWADKIYDWERTIGLIDKDYYVYDGADANLNCSEINHIKYSYVIGVHLMGAAYMYDVTKDQKWKERVDGHLSKFQADFFPNGGQIMVETACEPIGTCNYDMRSFKAYGTRWLALTTQLAPWTKGIITPLLKGSAAAAAKACTGPDSACGLRWDTGTHDGSVGPGEQMAAMSVFANLLALKEGDAGIPPFTSNSGGTSRSDPNAGMPGQTADWELSKPITTGDRAGAGILTFLAFAATIGMVAFVLT